MHLIPVWEGGRKPVQESKYLIWFGFCRLHIFVCFFCYFSMSRKSVQNHFSSVLVGETASPLGQKMYALKKKKKTLQTGIVHVFDINTLYLYKKKKKPTPYPHPHAFLSSSLHLPTIPQCSPPRREWPSLSHERRKKENIGKMAKKQRKQRRERQIDWFPRGGGWGQSVYGA